MTILPTRLDPARTAQLYTNGFWRHETLADIAARRVAEAPDRVIVTDGDRVLTRRELLELAAALAGSLRGLGIQPGDSIGFQLPNWWEACVINLAAALGGYVVVPLLPIFGRAELADITRRTQTKLLFVPEEFRGTPHLQIARDALPDVEIVQVRGQQGGQRRFEEMLDTAPVIAPAEPDAVKLILFTSGSTGRPKGVLHTHNTIHALSRYCEENWEMGPADVLFVPSSVAHIGGSIYAFEMPWIIGCSALLMDRWQADAAVALINQHDATFCAAATPFLRELIVAARAARTHLPGLRRFICGGASVSSGLIEEAAEEFPNAVVSRAYGSTEVPTLAPGIRNRDDVWACAHTDGQVRTELRLLDNGEIVARAPQMFMGYLDAPDNDGVFTEDGYFRMGDLGRVIDGKYIEVIGRTKDIIIRAGENLSPREVENCLLTHPAIRDIAIVGVPDTKTGEAAFAFVQCRAGERVTLADLAAHIAAAGLAKQKIPEYLLVVEDLPMSTVGKVRKDMLRTQAPELREKAEARR